MRQVELVALGQSNGRRPPLFCIPGAGGEIGTFEEMASLIADDRAVYGIDLRGFFATDRKFTVEQVADVCLSAIREATREPYYLCGYSFGALVAYQVASLLSRSGQDIGVLALIDTGNPAFATKLSSTQTKQLGKRYIAHRLHRYVGLLISGNIRTLTNSVAALFAARVGLKSRRLIRTVFRAMNRPMPSVFRFNDRALFEAWRAYKPPATCLPLLLFYEEHRCADYGGDRTLGWSLCTSGHIDIEIGLGGHVGMMKHQHVASFAARFSREFQK